MLRVSEFDDNEWLVFFHVSGINRVSSDPGLKVMKSKNAQFYFPDQALHPLMRGKIINRSVISNISKFEGNCADELMEKSL